MDPCFFVADLHGKIERYEKLFSKIVDDLPSLVLLGGDLLPHGIYRNPKEDFTREFLFRRFLEIKKLLGQDYPRVMIILGNDDPGTEAKVFLDLEEIGVWQYIHFKKVIFRDYPIYGYSFIPPSPFRFKDWERYDVSKYVGPGCISMDEGIRTIVPDRDIEHTTIQSELKELIGEDDLSKAVFLFHSPPYGTYLDRAALDDRFVDGIPLDVHVGSMAIKRIIEERQPYITLHGHIHESARLTGHWKQQFGRTYSFTAAHDGPELSLIVLDLDHPGEANRLLL